MNTELYRTKQTQVDPTAAKIAKSADSKLTTPEFTMPVFRKSAFAISDFTASALNQILHARNSQIRHRIFVLCAMAVLFCIFFATYDALTYWELIGALRLPRLVGLIVVASAISASTVVFQTVTRNRILSPSIMGFDSLYRLIATLLIFGFSSGVISSWNPALVFTLQATLMTLAAVALFSAMIRRSSARIHLMILIGIVFGTLMRSITAMLSAIMDPNEFQNVQDLAMASFAAINQPALVITLIVTTTSIFVIIQRANTWDLLALGRDTAIGLGVNYAREVKFALALSSLLVAAATALVGPLMFFGLLVVNIAVYFLRTNSLRYLVPGSIALGICVLIGGQGVLEFVLNQATVLPVVIELVGGALLLGLILKEVRS